MVAIQTLNTSLTEKEKDYTGKSAMVRKAGFEDDGNQVFNGGTYETCCNIFLDVYQQTTNRKVEETISQSYSTNKCSR